MAEAFDAFPHININTDELIAIALILFGLVAYFGGFWAWQAWMEFDAERSIKKWREEGKPTKRVQDYHVGWQQPWFNRNRKRVRRPWPR